PYPKRRRIRASWTSAVVISIPAGRPSIIPTSPEPCDSPAVNQRIIGPILSCSAQLRLLHVDVCQCGCTLAHVKSQCCRHMVCCDIPVNSFWVCYHFLDK